MIRPLRLIDLMAFFSFLGRALPNHALSRVRLGKPGLPSPRVLLWPGFPLRRRYSWVEVEGGRIWGLVSARRRTGPWAWEIDTLALEGEDCRGLLQEVGRGGARHGVGRVFLRLAAQSPLLEAAREAGYTPYLTEFLYRGEGGGSRPSISPLLRPRLGADELGLFQLYNAAVPERVRQAEAMTFGQWRQTVDGGQGREFVAEGQGRLWGWFRVSSQRDGGSLEIITHPNAEILEPLLDYGLALLSGMVFCLVPQYQGHLGQPLEERGFALVGEFLSLVKSLASPVRERRWIRAPWKEAAPAETLLSHGGGYGTGNHR